MRLPTQIYRGAGLMRLKRRLAEGLASKLGLHVLPRIDAWSWPEEHYWRVLFAELDIDCVFDVGANVGQFAQLLRTRGYQGLILSFEPVPATVAKLKKAAAGDPQWKVFQYAFGAEAGSLPFNVMQGSDFSSFLAPSDDPDLPFHDANVVAETIDVEVKTIAEMFDRLQAEFQFSRPFLKMDTQGYDLQVVRGAGDHIDKFLAVLSEISWVGLYDGSPTMTESVKVFRERGFDLARMFPVHPELLLKLLELNAYFINRRIVTG